MSGSRAKNAEPARPLGSPVTHVQSRGVKSGEAAPCVAIQPLGPDSKSEEQDRLLGAVGAGAALRGRRLAQQGLEAAERRGVRSSTAAIALATCGAVRRGEGLAGRHRRCSAGERLPDQIRARRLERVGVVGEVAVLDLVHGGARK